MISIIHVILTQTLKGHKHMKEQFFSIIFFTSFLRRYSLNIFKKSEFSNNKKMNLKIAKNTRPDVLNKLLKKKLFLPLFNIALQCAR